VRFTLNGRSIDVRAHPVKRLLDVLREDCALTGTKEGCGEGECGACTVLVDGKAVNACLVPFAQVRGARVTTIEGIRGARALQEAFVREGATQCGICTPGLIVAASTLPRHATLDEVRTALAGNICRCTGYAAVYRAIQAAQAVGKPGAGKALRLPDEGRRRSGQAGKAGKAAGAGVAGVPRRRGGTSAVRPRGAKPGKGARA
jgi:aerobic carbon-monoxide dehydrogenase small subunit